MKLNHSFIVSIADFSILLLLKIRDEQFPGMKNQIIQSQNRCCKTKKKQRKVIADYYASKLYANGDLKTVQFFLSISENYRIHKNERKIFQTPLKQQNEKKMTKTSNDKTKLSKMHSHI